MLKNFLGSHEQPYPPYSAARVHGKPLYYWARENKLDTITIPTKTISIESVGVQKISQISSGKLLVQVKNRIAQVAGDFRQSHILESWEENVAHREGTFPIVTISVRCSSGTYMRSIAHEFGKKLGVGAIAYRIVRTSVGPYSILKP